MDLPYLPYELALGVVSALVAIPYIQPNLSLLMGRKCKAFIRWNWSSSRSIQLPLYPLKTQDRRPCTAARQDLHDHDWTAAERRRPLPPPFPRVPLPDPPVPAALRPGADVQRFLPCTLGNEPYTSLGPIGCLSGPLIQTIGAGPVAPFSIDSEFLFLPFQESFAPSAEMADVDSFFACPARC